MKEIKAGNIKVIPDISEITAHGVITQDDQEHPFDDIVLCTGYRARLDEMIPGLGGQGCPLDHAGLPKNIVGEGDFEGLYFLGYDNYRPGGILGIIYQDSEKIAEDIASKH